MATNTYIALDKVTVGTATPTVTFSSISGSYTDLVLVVNGNSSVLADSWLRLNGDTGSNYSDTRLYGNGSSVGTDRRSNQTKILAGDVTTNGNTVSILQIMNYSNTTTNKTVLIRSGYASSILFSTVGLYRSTSAVTSVSLTIDSGNWSVGTTFSLYGIAAEGAAYATGGMVTSDSQYYYHTFTSTGAFVPKQSLTCDVLAIAGGGGGGSGNNSGGGGAGGLLAFTSQSLTATSYTVTVGAGGSTASPDGNNGSDSQFGSLTLVKGGGFGAGSGGTSNTGGTGGSGGGNPFDNTGAGGSATSGQGFAGGTGQGLSGPNYYGGGGGGAGEAGNTDGAGNGGDGSSSYSSWGSVSSTGQNVGGTYYYAGGGGGAGQITSTSTTGGDGGGGRGAGNAGLAAAGLTNTGGGGGGGGTSAGTTGGAGGSGIVIVRYAK